MSVSAACSALIRATLFVRDLENTTIFYRGLGLEEVYFEGTLDDASASSIIGFSTPHPYRVRIVKRPGPNYGMVGLFQLASGFEAETIPPAAGPARIGEVALVFYVRSMAGTLAKLRAAGATWSPEPELFRMDHRAQAEVCLRDPDGVLLNLVEGDPAQQERTQPELAYAGQQDHGKTRPGCSAPVMRTPPTNAIRRRFLDLPARQIHYRIREGGGPPLLVLHALPGSSLQMEPLLAAMDERMIVAPDLAGLGDSGAHPRLQPTIADYAADMLSLLDGLGLDAVDVYGSHTGAAVGVEMAVGAPSRVKRLVIEGAPLFTPAETETLKRHYAPLIEPDINGAHLLWAHNFCRDQILFWPWYERTAAARRPTGLPSAAELHSWVLDVLKGLTGFRLGYQSVFDYPMAERLGRVSQPTLCIAAEVDVLAEATRQALEKLTQGELVLIPNTGEAMADPLLVAQSLCRYLIPSSIAQAS